MTLQKLCLKRIAESIDLYSRAYTTVDNQYLQQGFYILQKIYSHELISSLTNKGLLKEDHADLVFNEHIKSIDTEWFSNYTWKKIMEIFTRIGPSVLSIKFKRLYNKEKRLDFSITAWEEVARLLPNVKAITCLQECTNNMLRCIAESCARLETLDFGNSLAVTDDGVLHFCEIEKGQKRDSEGECISPEKKVPCPYLREIRLGDNEIMNRVGIRGHEQLLIKVPSLQRMDSCHLPLVLWSIHSEKHFKTETLTQVDLTHGGFCVECQNIEETLKVVAAVCPNLKSIKYPVYSLAQLKSLSQFSNVTSFALDFKFDDGTDGAEFSNFLKEHGQKVTSLSFCEADVPISLLGQFCPRLKKLRLEQVSIQYNEKESVAVFRNLKDLSAILIDFEVPANVEAMCQILRLSPALEDLDIFRWREDVFPSEVENEILKCFEQCPLKYFGFRARYPVRYPTEFQIRLRRLVESLTKEPRLVITQ